MKKVLITGGTGFVGSATVAAILHKNDVYDCEIHVITSQKPQDISGVVFHEESLLDYKKTEDVVSEIKPDYLIHLAWYVNPKDYLSSDKNLLWVGASLNLLRAFNKNGGKRIIMCGTCFEYDFKNEALNEQAGTNPLTLYAQCKLNLQNIAQKFSKDNGISFVWARLFYLYGENESEGRVVPYIIKNLLQDQSVICKNSDAVRDYMYIKDAGNAIVKTLFSNVEGIINVASGKEIRMHDIFTICAQIMRKENLVQLKNESVIPRVITADNTKMKNEVGYTGGTNLFDGMYNTIEWWKEKEKNII